jgi:cobaltochelatase CobS
MIPQIQKEYVQWGNFETIKTVIETKKFFPLWITGLAGNGKTSMIEQACAMVGREFVRVNFTAETDEGDLIGSMRLENGDTKFTDGPVTKALRNGAILLLDEVDVAGSNKVLALQSVLEGKGVLIKATGEYVKPKEGFNIFATSNTKGRGSDDGKFIGTNIMNAAFLDRFHAMLYQAYPDKETETKILQNYYVSEHFPAVEDASQVSNENIEKANKFIKKLTSWSAHIRETFENGGIDEVITTRSLVSIIKAHSIFYNEDKAIAMICERFDTPVRDAFLDIYDKLTDDGEVVDPAPQDEEDEYEIFTPDEV